MALIIKGDMPKACIDFNGNQCCLFDRCFERTWTVGFKSSDCPIIGEIPYELENFIIAMSQLPREKPKTAMEAKEALAFEELERRMKKENQNDTSCM